jgi:hypothetical protein
MSDHTRKLKRAFERWAFGSSPPERCASWLLQRGQGCPNDGDLIWEWAIGFRLMPSDGCQARKEVSKMAKLMGWFQQWLLNPLPAWARSWGWASRKILAMAKFLGEVLAFVEWAYEPRSQEGVGDGQAPFQARFLGEVSAFVERAYGLGL